MYALRPTDNIDTPTEASAWTIFALAMLTTLGLQILSNFANDYGDGTKGTDNADRIGPRRAIQSGAISPSDETRHYPDFGLDLDSRNAVDLSCLQGFQYRVLLVFPGLGNLGHSLRHSLHGGEHGLWIQGFWRLVRVRVLRIGEHDGSQLFVFQGSGMAVDSARHRHRIVECGSLEPEQYAGRSFRQEVEQKHHRG